MECERDRFNRELEAERKKRVDLEVQVKNPEEGELDLRFLLFYVSPEINSV